MAELAGEVGVDREQQADIVDKGRRLIQFLKEAQRLRVAPVRTIETYAEEGAVIWLGDLPTHDAVATALRSVQPEPEDPLLVVKRVDAVPAPAPDRQLLPWIDGRTDDPEEPPTLRDSRTVVHGDQRVDLYLHDAAVLNSTARAWHAAWEAWARRERADRPVRQMTTSMGPS